MAGVPAFGGCGPEVLNLEVGQGSSHGLSVKLGNIVSPVESTRQNDRMETSPGAIPPQAVETAGPAPWDGLENETATPRPGAPVESSAPASPGHAWDPSAGLRPGTA